MGTAGRGGAGLFGTCGCCPHKDKIGNDGRSGGIMNGGGALNGGGGGTAAAAAAAA